MATAVFYIGMLLAIAAGVGVNLLASWKLARRWQRVLAIVAGFLVLMVFLSFFFRLALRPQPGPLGIGEAIGTAIGMALGPAIFLVFSGALYIVSTLLTSLARYARRKLDERRKDLKGG